MSESKELTRQQTSSLKKLIASPYAKEQFSLALPKHLTVDRFIRVALTALNKNPKLLGCTQESVMACMMDCSSLGIEPDGRRAHLIAYGDKCTLIIDYKGLIELAKRSGDVKSWSAMLVCEKDKFTWENGAITHSINWLEDRGKPLAVYSHVVMADGQHEYEVMTLAEVDAIRNRSRAGSSGPWVTDYAEMAKKTVIRRHSKRLTLSPEFRDAEAKDGDVIDLVEDIGFDEEKSKAASDTLKAKKKAKEQPKEAVDTPANSDVSPRETPDDFDDKEREAIITELERAAINTPKKFEAHLKAFNLSIDTWKAEAATSDLMDIASRLGLAIRRDKA